MAQMKDTLVFIEFYFAKPRFSYNIDKSMFCAGNNTERIRMAKVECTNETIVDLYAGYLD